MRKGPVHPGEILLEEFLKPNHATPKNFAKTLDWNEDEVIAICKCKRKLSPELAERLAAFLGNSSDFWLNLQKNYDEARR